MKIKSEKKPAKRESPASDDEEPARISESAAKSAKITKLPINGLVNGHAKGDESVTKPSTEKNGASMNVSIFQHFKELTNEEDDKRMKAALQLLQQLSKQKEPEKRQKELLYTLKRLVRGCGAATNTSRAGFYTGLVALFKAFDEQEITLEQVFDTMQKELHVGATVGNKDDADAVVGKLLVCGALQQAGRLNIKNSEYLERITNTLLQATKQRSYHASLGYALLIEFVEKLTTKQFNAIVWPLLQVELQRPWAKQTLETLNCLFAVRRLQPNVVNAKFIKAHFGYADLLQPESFPHFYRLFWEHTNMQQLTHPAFEHVAAYIANSENLCDFWIQQVDAGLEKANKVKELITLKVATDIFNNWQKNEHKTEKKHLSVTDLLSTNFMHLLVEGLKNQRQKKDETMKAFYDDFFEALSNCCMQLGDDAQLVDVIRRLILPPGLFSIEKYTSSRVIHQLINSLGFKGVKDIYKLYRSIFLGSQPKNIENANETWLNFERMNAGYMLQHLIAHKAARSEHKWRENQLRFLLTCGIFHVNEATEICKKESASTFSNEFAEQCKNMFFTSMQSRLVDLQLEKQLLLNLVQFCNERIEQKHAAKYFRIKQYSDSLQKHWQQMYEVAGGNGDSNKQKKDKKKSTKIVESDDNKLELVFQILLLNMGLQLFREPEMAGPSIADLLKCMQRVKEKHSFKKNSNETKPNTNDEEPEWIEVVVDLFLHLLSQNASALRNIVNALFPHLCDSLNLSAVHQILAVLDMKDGHNPLTSHGGESNDDNTDAEDEDEERMGVKNGKSKKTTNGKGKNDAQKDEEEASSEAEDDEDEDEDDDDDEDDDSDEDEEVTAADKLRNAVSQALMAHSGGDGGEVDNDDDMASIDLNDISEEQGRKLDEALAEAFKVMRKTGSGAATKKSKSYRIKVTTVMHFRIRVLDLIEIYFQQQQPSLLIAIEIMLALFNMLPHCLDDELKPLRNKVEKVLQKLTISKCDITGVKEDEMVSFIRLIVEQKSPVAIFDAMNKLRNKCIIFLVNNAIKIVAGKEENAATIECRKVLALCHEYMEEFLQSRNPSVNITLLSDLVRLRWCGVWNLGVKLAHDGLTMQTRAFRRIQIYEILDVLYKNHDLQRLDAKNAKKHLKEIEVALCSHINALAANRQAAIGVSPKEYAALLQLLIQTPKTHHRLQSKSALASLDIAQAVQNLYADKTQLYQRFCAAYKLPVVRDKNMKKQKTENGKQVSENQEVKDVKEVESVITASLENGIEHEAPKKRKKSNEKAFQKLKKQKKEQRLRVASEGLNGGFAYVRPESHATNESADEV